MKDAVIDATKQIVKDLGSPKAITESQSQTDVISSSKQTEFKSNFELKKQQSAPDLMTMGRQMTMIRGLIDGIQCFHFSFYN